MPTLRLVANEDVVRLRIPVAHVVTLVEEALLAQAAGRTVMPAKSELSESRGWFLHSMPAIVSDVGAGVKWVSYNPLNRRLGLPNSSALLVLNDIESSLPCCIVDALWATYARTAACAVLSMRHLARDPVRVVALVGGGQMARTLVPLIDEALPELERFQVVTRSAASARAFVEAVAGSLRTPIQPARDIAEAVSDADVVISAIGEARRPPLTEQEFHPGMLALPLDAEHAWTSAALRRADKVFTDDRAVFESGFSRRRPYDTRPVVTGELGDVIAGKVAGRESPDERIACSNNGIAILDVVLGFEIHRRALVEGLGIDVPLSS